MEQKSGQDQYQRRHIQAIENPTDCFIVFSNPKKHFTVIYQKKTGDHGKNQHRMPAKTNRRPV
jgi:hypothetical protein